MPIMDMLELEKGKLHFIKNKQLWKKNISEEKAVTALIDLIKEHGDWVEKKN